MASSVLVLFVLFVIGLVAIRVGQVSRLRRLSLHRIGLQVQENILEGTVFVVGQQSVRTYPHRYRFAPPAAGLLAAALVWWGTGLPHPLSIGTGVLVGAIAYLVEVHWANSMIERIESQLADAIDLMVSALRAGAAVLAALEATLAEARNPIRDELETMIHRIRLGEDPRQTAKDLAVRVPLESFRLYSHSLLVHWETGGSLTSSLKTVGRTLRDRIEVSRRINAQAIESQVSVIVVMAIAYGLIAFMLYSNPGPIRKLIYSEVGAYIAAGLMILQAIGMVWIWSMSRIRF